jgi:flagella basal body P-ring formation protein FlgA
MRKFLLILPLALVLFASSALADGVRVRAGATVRGDYIRLGDLFENAGEKAGAQIAYAPAPGERAIFDAQWLYNVARAYGLDWRPLTLRTRIVVERDSQLIGQQEIEDQLKTALAQYDIGDAVDLELNNAAMRIYVAADEPATVGVEGLSYDPSTGRFTATIAAPADKPSAYRTRVTGRVHQLVEVPVLTKRVRAGHLIRERDVTWVNMRERKVGRDTITDGDQLIGMAAKRPIGPGKRILVSEVRRPLLVPKGSLVTMELRTDQMRLSVQGRALDEGSKGDVIRIVNPQSNAIVEAVVTAAGLAVVQAPPLLASN